MNLLLKSSHLVQESTYDPSMSCNFMKHLLKSICSENKQYQINSTAAKICIFKGFYSDWNKNDVSKYSNINNNIITR